MKTLKTLLAAAFVVFAACAKIVVPSGTPINSAGEYAITFSHYPQTKALATSQSKTGYDDFALFAWNSNNDTIMKPYTVHAEGTGYVYDDVSGQELQYFSNAASSYKFLGVIPTTHTMKLDNGVVTVEDLVSFTADDSRVSGTLTADSPEEFLFASTSVAKANYKDIVNLQFNHGNAVVYLGFSSDKNTTKLLDYTPYTPGSPAQPAVPGTTTTTTKTGKALDMLYNGEIVYWPYAGDAGLTSTQPNNFYKNTSNYGNMGSLMDAVNAQFVYYNTSGTVTTNAWPEGNKKDMYGLQLATTTNKDDFVGGTTEDTWKDAFWANASDGLKNTFRPSYAAGWRVIRIEHIAGTQYDAWLLNNTEMTYKVITTTGGSPAVPAVPESGFKGIRVFSADSLGVNSATDTLYCKHVAHTTKADATISSTGCVLSNRSVSNEVIQFSLPTNTTLSATPTWSPTTFYALPGDTGFNFLVVKLSYEYDGKTVYDVRVPIKLPDGGLKPGKYYKYELHITSTGNGTNDPNEASDEKDEIIIESLNPIVVNLSVAGYELGADEKIII